MTTLRPLTGISKRVYDDIMGLDPVGAVEYARMVVAGALQHDLETHTELIQHRVDQVLSKRVQTVKKGLVRAAISKSRAGGEIDELEAVNQVIAKAGDFGFLTDAERRRLAGMQDRDQSGRFKSMNRKIKYSQTKPLPGRYAQRLGIDASAQNLSGKKRAEYQQAYLQVNDMLKQFADLPVGMGTLALTYRMPNGQLERRLHDAGSEQVPLDANVFEGPGRLVDAQVIVDGGIDVQGAAFNLVGALGSPAVAGRAVATMNQDAKTGTYAGADRLGTFAEDWHERMDSDVKNPGNRIFRRLSTGSRMLEEMGGENLPNQLKLALKTADMVGQYGPEAQKVIGPTADKAAYRYRGVERTPAPGLQGNLDAYTHKTGSKENARQALIYGEHREVATRGGSRLDFHESPIIDYFKGRLADENLTELQRKSGVIPPSEGIIIDKNGKVVTQAVGYGDDWYLPFNLKTLSKLKGGDYVRTRTWGGITTEDVYTGLISGARSVTVVSHNGVYTVEFDQSFKGSRRYNDKAARMVKRYGHLLDAVKSQQVTLSGVPADRLEEIKGEAAKEFDPTRREERAQYEQLVTDLKADEKRNPKMSDARRKALAEEYLNEQASHRHTADGTLQTWDVMAQDYVDRTVGEEKRLYEATSGGPEVERQLASMGIRPNSFDESVARRLAHGRVSTPEAAITTLGMEKGWGEHLSRAEAEYKAAQSPLNLDGEGYNKAGQALKEQFPYYIANVTYRPNKTGGFDHGYVKPKFNRPEGAKTGYFDATISGAGKVSADETRYQNQGVDVRAVKEARKVVPVDKEKEREAGSVSRAAARGSAPADKNAALKALYDEVKGAKTWGTGAGPLAGKAIGSYIPDSVTADFGLFRNKSWDDWLDDLVADSKAGDRLVAAAASLKEKGAVDISSSKLAAAKDPEKAAKGADFDPQRAVGNPDRDYDFGDDLAPGRRADQYQHMVENLEKRVGPQADLDAHLKDLGALHAAAVKARDTGQRIGNIRAADEKKYADQIREVVMLKQAKRRLADKQGEDAEIADLEARQERASLAGADVMITASAQEAMDAAAERAGKTIPGKAEPNDGRTVPYTKRIEE